MNAEITFIIKRKKSMKFADKFLINFSIST